MDRRLTLQRPSKTRNRYGEELTAWTDVADVWASIATVRREDGEEVKSAQLRSVQQREAHIRYRTDVDTEWRVQYDGKAWDIVGIVEVGRRAGLQLTLEHGLREG